MTNKNTGKWCTYCCKSDHSDAECWCTRVVNFTAQPVATGLNRTAISAAVSGAAPTSSTPRHIPHSECIQGRCANITTGCWGECGLRAAFSLGNVVCGDAVAQPRVSEQADERTLFEKAMNAARFFPAELSFARTKSPSGRDDYANSHLQSCWEGFQIGRSITQPAPEALYQVQFHDESNSSAWHDASEAAYHTFMPERRRIVYTSPVAAPEAPASEPNEKEKLFDYLTALATDAGFPNISTAIAEARWRAAPGKQTEAPASEQPCSLRRTGTCSCPTACKLNMQAVMPQYVIAIPAATTASARGHIVWVRPGDAAVFDLYDTNAKGQEFQICASSQKTATHTIPFSSVALAQQSAERANEAVAWCVANPNGDHLPVLIYGNGAVLKSGDKLCLMDRAAHPGDAPAGGEGQSK